MKKLFYSLSIVSFMLIGVVIVRAQGMPAECQFSGAPTPEQNTACQNAIQLMQQEAMKQAEAAQQGGQQGGMPEGGKNQGDGANMGPSEEQQKAMEAKQLEKMKTGVTQMEKGIAKINDQIKRATDAGEVLSTELQDNLKKVHSIIDAAKAATTVEEFEKANVDEVSDLMDDISSQIGDLREHAEMTKGLKRGVKGMRRGFDQFTKALDRVKSQKIAVPEEIQQAYDDANTLITGIEKGKNWADLEKAGAEKIEDIMSNLGDYRPAIEMLSRWPKVRDEANKQINKLNNKKDNLKAVVDKLAIKDIDVSENYATLTKILSEITASRDLAVANVNQGKGEDAFDTMDEKVFSRFDDAYEQVRIIETMNGLSKFKGEFNKAINSSNAQIKALDRKKLDTKQLKEIIGRATAKGNEAVNLIKQKNLDEEKVLSKIEDLENIKQEFQDEVDNLTGGAPMPGIGPKDQLQEIQIPQNGNK